MRSSATEERDGDVARLGVVCMVGSVTVLSGMDALGKSLVARYSVVEMIGIRGVGAVAILALLLGRRGRVAALHPGHPWVQLFRGGCLLGVFLLYYQALRTLPLAEGTAIFFGAPFVMTALSALLLHERVEPLRWLILVIGFAGVVVVVGPSTSGIQPAALLAAAGSVLYPLAMVVTRRLGNDEPATTTMAWSLGVQAVVAGIVTPFVWETPRGTDWLFLVGLTLAGLVGHFLLTHAFQKAPVAVLAPLEYSGLVLAACFGFVAFGDVPSGRFWFGAPLIVGAGVLGAFVQVSGSLGGGIPELRSAA